MTGWELPGVGTRSREVTLEALIVLAILTAVSATHQVLAEPREERIAEAKKRYEAAHPRRQAG